MAWSVGRHQEQALGSGRHQPASKLHARVMGALALGDTAAPDVGDDDRRMGHQAAEGGRKRGRGHNPSIVSEMPRSKGEPGGLRQRPSGRQEQAFLANGTPPAQGDLSGTRRANTRRADTRRCRSHWHATSTRQEQERGQTRMTHSLRARGVLALSGRSLSAVPLARKASGEKSCDKNGAFSATAIFPGPNTAGDSIMPDVTARHRTRQCRPHLHT